MKNFFIFSVIVILSIITYFIIIRNNRDDRLIKEASVLISKIEDYRKLNGRPPSSLKSAGLISPTQGADELYYSLIEDSLVYMITYGNGLGESIAYYSDTKEWGRFVGRIR